MSASLVGSEMCIRDRTRCTAKESEDTSALPLLAPFGPPRWAALSIEALTSRPRTRAPSRNTRTSAT
eukprot:4808160-Alexandrium_andersonii.AAC.1